jgi:alpha-glucoside transport system substrate-binding protein
VTRPAVGALLSLLLLAGCATTTASVEHESATSSPYDPACAPFAPYQGAPGTTVTFLIGELTQPAIPLETSWADFTRCTGIRVVNQVDRSTPDDFLARLDSGNAPDLTVFAQPGGIADLVRRQERVGGPRLVPLPAAVADNVDRYWNPAWRSYGTVDGTLYAAPWDAAAKSLVWYSPKRFAAAGYTVPHSWQELIALSDRIVADGGSGKPWCGGLESGSATGWPATDWLEEIILGQFGGETYDRWVAHEIPFDSPEIRSAMKVLDEWMHNPAYVNGGFGDVASMARTSFPDAGRHILDGGCFMYPFPSFYGAQWSTFKSDVTIGPDGDVFAFPLPAVNPEMPNPLVGSGDFVVAFSDRPEVQLAQAYFSSADWATRRAVVEDWQTANTGVPLDAFHDPISRLSAELLTAPNTTFRFDGSDLMPTVVQDEEWKQLTAWFAEGKPTRDVLRAIDAAWPSASP